MVVVNKLLGILLEISIAALIKILSISTN